MFRIKQIIKMLLQNILLPPVYAWHARKPVEKGRILFADAHHDEVPFSMRRVYEALTLQTRESPGGIADEERRITLCIRDFDKMSYMGLLRYLLWFMKQYATAEYVFICDYYLPVSSCRRRPETKVVQLWHSCGLMKKIAHDAGQDIPQGYRGNMFGNYTYLTLSAQVCVPVHARALRIPEDRIFATGVSRTDYYFDEEWNRRCRNTFYEEYPQARGKRIALWAPTFRGNAGMPRLEGLEDVRRAAEALSGEWYFVIKAHPYVDAREKVSNCEIPTEELLPVADLMITDYSSVMFDYLLYKKPIVLFAPDLERYEAERGFYIDYHKLPYPITGTGEELERAIRSCRRDGPGRAVFGTEGLTEASEEQIDRFREKYVGACDGHATERILKLAGLE